MPLDRLRRRLSPTLERVGALVEHRLAPAARMAAMDPSLARAWLRHEPALRDVLGAEIAAKTAQLLLQAAQVDLHLARNLVVPITEQLGLVPPNRRAAYLAVLTSVAGARPQALALLSRTLPRLLAQLDDQALAFWIEEALRRHARSPAEAEAFLRMETQGAQVQAAALRPGIPLESVRRTLTLYARAHCGRSVDLRPATPGGPAFTDGRNLFLPERADFFGDERDEVLFRVWTALAVAHIEFGSLEVDLEAIAAPQPERGWPAPQAGELEIERFFRAFPNRSLARDLFLIIERERVRSCLCEEYPGLSRDIERVSPAFPLPTPPDDRAPVIAATLALEASVRGLTHPPGLPLAALQAAAQAWSQLAGLNLNNANDSLRATLLVYPPIDALFSRGSPGRPPTPPAGSGRRGPRDTDPTPQGGEAKERGPLTQEEQLEQAFSPPAGLDIAAAPPEIRQEEEHARSILAALRQAKPEADLKEARARAREERSYEEMERLLDAQDAPAGPIQENVPERPTLSLPEAATGTGLSDDATWNGVQVLHPEWDHRVGDLKPAWVRVKEHRVVVNGPASPVEPHQAALIAQVRRAFEGLRPQAPRIERGLTDGDELDLDRALAERIERRAGVATEGRIYSRRRPQERDVAVAFLLDLSSSTNEVVDGTGKRIIDIEKEALRLAVEAADAIGDRCAVWGFSGYGRDQVAFYIAKEFEEPWDDAARARVGRMRWKMENRDGAAIRHATKRILEDSAKIRLLILLSDGRPLDCGCDHYRDRYAQEDTREALAEARRQGVHPFCITVDPQAQVYLERMYGEGSYLVIDRVEALPERLLQAWRRLTR